MRRVVFNQKGRRGQIHDHLQPGGDQRPQPAHPWWSTSTPGNRPTTCWAMPRMRIEEHLAGLFEQT